jgi:hypothetical protein
MWEEPGPVPAAVNPTSAVARKDWLRPNSTLLNAHSPAIALPPWAAAAAIPDRRASTQVNVTFCINTPAKPTSAHPALPTDPSIFDACIPAGTLRTTIQILD